MASTTGSHTSLSDAYAGMSYDAEPPHHRNGSITPAHQHHHSSRPADPRLAAMSSASGSATSSPAFGPLRTRGVTSDATASSARGARDSDQSQGSQHRLAPGHMYHQSNTSAPAFDHGTSGSRGPPLADELGHAFDKMNVGGGSSGSATASLRAKSPAPPGVGVGGNTSAYVERANAAYAHQEIYQSAREVDPSNSLAAIANEVDATANELGGNIAGGYAEGRRASDGSYVQSNTSFPPQPGFHPQVSRQQSVAGGYGPSQQGWVPSDGGGGGGGGYGQQQEGGYWQEDGNGSGYYVGAPQDHFATAPHHHGGPSGYFGGASGSSYGHGQGGGYDQGYYQQGGNGYEYSGAGGYLGFPPGAGPPNPDLMRAPSTASHVSMGMTPMSGGLQPGMGLVRQPTQLSMSSAVSTGSAAANARRKSKEAEAKRQTLPFNKEFVDEYRHRMKGDPDPEAQFAFAKYLIEAAKKVQDPRDGPKQARKYRDALLGDSLKLIKRLATTGMGLGKPPYSEAQYFLANCFGTGSLGLQVDHEKAYNLYVQASKQNHAAATYRTAVCNEVGAGTRRDHHRAVLFYRKASALGDTAGMYKLGMILLNGLLGQPRNIREAVVWLKRAAGQADEENPHALHELGLLHEKGGSSVVMHDEAYARELFTQAAQLGYTPSQFKLGSAYEYGHLTCPVDPRRSIAWYTKAAGKNDGESELALSGWYLTGSEGVLKQSDSEAYLWARKAAQKGIPKAEYAVGYYSEVGIGVKSDVEEAKRWYMRAAAQGNKRAMQRLTELKRMGGKAGKTGKRPTRGDAQQECVIV
ncbi:Extracellular protein SEL-1 and related proteins [Ceraceosorus bombacis]|uniref:Extracellular protein SEL-1 and related proteins n=1 Tax=Ceraceosorus bombacis TaxID=401625 RepID=A0A0P1BFV5_9BASI|nr:Extracellular protein SEL-1 and related proteins [Ceraceosorus bombacis]